MIAKPLRYYKGSKQNKSQKKKATLDQMISYYQKCLNMRTIRFLACKRQRLMNKSKFNLGLNCRARNAIYTSLLEKSYIGNDFKVPTLRTMAHRVGISFNIKI